MVRNTNKLNRPLSLRYISEILFLRIQQKEINRKGDKLMKNLLGMCLMKTKSLKTFIPQYIRYRFNDSETLIF